MAAEHSSWGYIPPETTELTLGCLMEPGSLTQRLMASRRHFAVSVLRFGADVAAPDEAPLLGILPGASMTVRHVALELDGEPVVLARSFCRLDCPVWQPILDRGGRSLGLTLFSGEVAVSRGALEFTLPPIGHPLDDLAAEFLDMAGVAPARRCRFVLGGAPMVVCEVFLPALEDSLSSAARYRVA